MLCAMGNLPIILDAVKALGVVGGVCFSVWSFNSTRVRRGDRSHFLSSARGCIWKQLSKQGFWQTLTITLQSKSQMPDGDFVELYVAELSMVESTLVESHMVRLAERSTPGLNPFAPTQDAAYDLSHALRDSFVTSWGIK